MKRMEYDFIDFDLLVEPDGVKLMDAAAGARTDREQVRNDDFQVPAELDLEQIEALVMQTADEADARSNVSRSEDWVREPRKKLRAFGQSLFSQLFPAGSALLYKYLASYMPSAANTADRLVRLRLRLRLNAKLAHIPWEILHASDNVSGGELALTASVVRTPTTQEGSAKPIKIHPPLKVLLVADSPYTAEQERLAEQEQLIRDTLARLEQDNLIQVKRLELQPHETSTLQAIGRVLEHEEIHVLHVMGHGYYDVQQDEPVGYLEMTRNGQAYDYTGQEVAEYLKPGAARSLRLVVLNACEGARERPSERSLEFTGVAQALLDVGLPAVLAMQFEISDPAARVLAGNLYRRLVETGSLDEAVRHTRYHLLNSITETLEWVTPVLFLADQDYPFELIETVVERPIVIPHLKKLSASQFTSYLEEKTKRFVGREYVFAAIDAFIADNPKGYFEIEGDPGVGKSAILAEFVRRTGAISHFNIRSQGIKRACQFLESVCTQLIQRYELPYASLPAEATRDGSFLGTLLEQAAAKLGPGERLIIAIDALDEVDDSTSQPGSMQNILYLPRVLPDHVYVVLTRRQLPLTLRADVPRTLLDLMKYQEESAQDVQTYIWRTVDESEKLREWINTRPERLSVPEFVIELTKLSECNFMYLYHMLPAIERGDYEDLTLESLPVGLKGYYEEHWVRMGMMARPLPRVKIRIVYILSEIRQPVSRKLITQFADSPEMRVDELMVQEVLDEWDEFLREEDTPEGTKFSVYHATFREFLHRQDIVQAAGVTIEGINALIADELWSDLFDDE